MNHTKSTFVFDNKGTEWIVEYYYIPEDGFERERLAARVLEDGEIYHDYGTKLPWTKTENPTKTQAKEIITNAKKLYVERDKRDKRINKLLNGTK